jgi:hypothetical protein
MTTQPEALRLADALELPIHESAYYRQPAAAELRRLHGLCEEMLGVLKRIDKEFRKYGRQHWPEAEKARAAIAKAEGQA